MRFWEWLVEGEHFLTFVCVGLLLTSWIVQIIKAWKGKE